MLGEVYPLLGNCLPRIMLESVNIDELTSGVLMTHSLLVCGIEHYKNLRTMDDHCDSPLGLEMAVGVAGCG